MSRLTDLIKQAKKLDPKLGEDLEAEIAPLAERVPFGLNFERHVPESTELPHAAIRKGSKVRILLPRGSASAGDKTLYEVLRVERVDGGKVAHIRPTRVRGAEVQVVATDDLVVVAEFEDYIYPGLKSTGVIQTAGDQPWHVVINGENYHAIETLLYTHTDKVDCIYIDPPYNTGGEWIYSDRYVEKADWYRHSKWLAFMERRLRLARALLRSDGALVISIGPDEASRLVLLCQQVFSDRHVELVTVQTSGGKPSGGFKVLHEYLVIVVPDSFVPNPMSFTGGNERTPHEGLALSTFSKVQRDNQAYPIFVERSSGLIRGVGPSLRARVQSGSFRGALIDFEYDYDEAPEGCAAVWPVSAKGEDCVWRLTPDRLMGDWEKGYIRVIPNSRRANRNEFSVQYLTAGMIKKVEAGVIEVTGKVDGAPTLTFGSNSTQGGDVPTIWLEKDFHTTKGTGHLRDVLGAGRFPYPKPVNLIMDVLKASTGSDAVVLDFFGGSGTTLEAVARLNSDDEGSRQCILVTNNEIDSTDTKALRKAGNRKGDPEWEAKGVYQYVTRPRIAAVVTGERPDGSTYDDTVDANVEFFDLTYESVWRVSQNRAFASVAPILWLKAGAEGARIDSVDDGWALADVYGVLDDLDLSGPFVKALETNERVRMAFIVTDDDRRFQDVCADLPERVEPVRLYESYLRNFEINKRRR